VGDALNRLRVKGAMVKGIAIALPLLLWAGWVMASEPSTLPEANPTELLREAATSNPTILAAQARLEATRHAPSQAEAPPDPEVSVAYTNDGLSSFTLGESEFAVLSLNWTQEIRGSHKRRQAGEVASRSTEAAEKEVQQTRLAVLSRVKSVYADLLRLDLTAAILVEVRGLLESLEETARLRYEVGEGVQESVLKAQTQILILEAESIRVAQDRRETEARLNAAVGRAAGTPVGPAQIVLQGELPEDISSLANSALAGSPEIGVLQAEVQRFEASAELARLEQKPDYIWSASYQYRGDLDPMVMGLFGVRLPIHKAQKQAQAVAQAESEITAARQELANLQIVTQSEVRELASRAQRSGRLLALYRQGIVPQAETTLESARSSYSVGRVGFLDLLNDLKALLEARRDEVSLEAERVQALAALEPLVGREFVEAPQDGDVAGGGHASFR
jgi:outer membrane protein, heavy metal efflux system